MAVQAQFNQDQEENQQQQQTQLAGPQAMQTSPMATTAPAAPKASSGRFTNVKSYLQANKGAGQQIAGRVAGQVGQQAQQAQRSAGEAEGIRSAVEAEKARLGQAQSFGQQIEQDPTQIAQNQQQAQQFQALLKPQGTSTQQEQQAGQQFGTALSNIQQAQQAAQNLGTESGRFGLLKKAFQTPSYSRGQQRLDQLLFQAGGAPVIQQKQKEYQGLLNQLAQGTQKTQEQVMADITANKQAEAEAAQMLGGKLSEQQQNLINAQQKEVEDLLKNRQATASSLQKFFETNDINQLSPEEQALVNQQLGDVMGQRTYNVLADNKWSQYLNQGNRNVTAQDVLDQQEFARYNALANLAGLTPEQMQFQQAGQGAGTEAGINQQKLAQDLAAAQQYFQDKSKQTTFRSQLSLDDILERGAGLGQFVYSGFEGSGTAADLLAGKKLPGYTNVEGESAWITSDILGDQGMAAGRGYRQLLENRLQQQLAQYLQEQGYGNILGGVKPTPGVV